ncbi:uncharacterized protein JCM15063_006080 [Sporobolomyces koalae]|uniref:uncharacterized protein n=1 Tax=Sporobolomyces koalae TaxID=500713 RepID=UPI003175AC8D
MRKNASAGLTTAIAQVKEFCWLEPNSQLLSRNVSIPSVIISDWSRVVVTGSPLRSPRRRTYVGGPRDRQLQELLRPRRPRYLWLLTALPLDLIASILLSALYPVTVEPAHLARSNYPDLWDTVQRLELATIDMHNSVLHVWPGRTRAINVDKVGQRGLYAGIAESAGVFETVRQSGFQEAQPSLDGEELQQNGPSSFS